MKVCLVNAYGTGFNLAKEFFDKGHKIIHVQVGKEIPYGYLKSFQPSLFTDNIVFDFSNTDIVLDFIKSHNPEIIITGSETGVPATDLLANELGLPGNSPNTSLLRRDKYQMNEAIKRNGLLSVRQALIENLEQLLDLASEWKIWPLVLKPIDSGGAEDVRFCHSEEELRIAFSVTHMKKNYFGFINEKVLVQERLYGQKYILNSVSISGKHKITEIWKEDRTSTNIYDRETLIPYHGEIQNRLIRYIKDVLDVVGIREGAAYSEVIMTAKGPTLIEVGARLQGGIIPSALHEALDENNLDALLRRYTEPEIFLKNIDKPYLIKKNIMVVNLISKIEGTLVRHYCNELLPTLPSFYSVNRLPNPGEMVKKTIDFITRTGRVYLVHDNISQLQQDYIQIRQWEKQEKFFEIR